MSEESETEEALFRVVFLHEFDEDADFDDVRRNVISRFNLSRWGTTRVFGGRPIVVRKNVDAETAFQIKIWLAEVGALSNVELMPKVDDTDTIGYVERRRLEQRQQRDDRRVRLRNEQIVPDRRQRIRRT